MADTDREQQLAHGTRGNAQAHLVRAAKVPVWEVDSKSATAELVVTGYRVRDWSMFYFFRILSNAEAPPSALHLSSLGADNARSSARFRDWLKTLLGDIKGATPGAASVLSLFPDKGGEATIADAQSELSDGDKSYIAQIAENMATALATSKPDELDQLEHSDTLSTFLITLRTMRKDVLAAILEGLDPARTTASSGILIRMVLFEMVREAAPAITGDTGPLSAIRCEANELKRRGDDELFDRTPVNFAFTYSGLEALKLDPATLASFPDAFRQGMAARAAMLHDVGPSAPENWEGELGLKSVHGYFTGAADLKHGAQTPETFWRTLRAEIRAYNDPVDDVGRSLRARIKRLCAIAGLEILHIELGQDPYLVEGDKVHRLPARKEHFGFRDGVSQPYVDLDLAPEDSDARPGDGTPSRRSTWTPAAAGEIFLDRQDEDGKLHRSPGNAALRMGSTFLVFRKLEQDVPGFRAYLAQQRASKPDRDALAAQFIGRWPNGTSLVHSPGFPRDMVGEAEASLNDFRYAVDDPLGRKCPLGAHVRRANPRDIGGRDDVRHHRILRRGISYGGRLLGEDERDDGDKRGVLFIAANARIDMQFEVIQSSWINGGEFLGQAGLDRCPLTGNRDGRDGTTFIEARSGVPIRGLPQFVTTRGGDYFFAPGIAALRGFANGDLFACEATAAPFAGLSTAAAAPVTPFGEAPLRSYAKRILGGETNVVRLAPKPMVSAQAGGPGPIAFVATHKDVTEVLCDKVVGGKTRFSVAQIREAGLRITRGDDWPIGTDVRGAGAAARSRLWPVLDLGWKKLEALTPDGEAGLYARLSDIVCGRLNAALRRVSGTRSIDLIDDFAAPGAYGVVAELYGLPGPSWLSELAIALPFARQHVGDLPREWLSAMRGETPTDPQLTTMQMWTCVMTADLIANAQQVQPLQVLSRQAGSEMINHIDLVLAKARARMATPGPSLATPTLIEAFIANEKDQGIEALYTKVTGSKDPQVWAKLYYRDVAVILLEIASSTLAIIPFTFAQVMYALIERRFDLPEKIPTLDPAAMDMMIYEAERLNPNVGFRLRRCEVETNYGEQTIHAGDMVMALTGAAGMDESVFPNPIEFLPGTPACPRNQKDYLLFGVPASKGSNKDCWGRDRVALPVLRECVRLAGRLRSMRRVAGSRGELQKLAGVTIGLPVRFTSLGPDVKLKPRPSPAPLEPASA